MGVLQDKTDQDVGSVPACKACGSQRVLCAAQACWNRETGLWELERVNKTSAFCQACDSKCELKWRRCGAIPNGLVQEMNDAFRCRLVGTGSIVMTSGISELGDEAIAAIMTKLQSFDTFTAENDPWGEHDFGALEHAGEKIFWKIDYYDLEQKNASPNPGNPAVTHRVLTIMLASEY